MGLDNGRQTVTKSITGVVPGADTDIDLVGNQTLGFEKVFAIGLPERSDKRDALT